MTALAERDEVPLIVAASAGSEAHVMNMERTACTTERHRAAPAIAFEDDVVSQPRFGVFSMLRVSELDEHAVDALAIGRRVAEDLPRGGDGLPPKLCDGRGCAEGDQDEAMQVPWRLRFKIG